MFTPIFYIKTIGFETSTRGSKSISTSALLCKQTCAAIFRFLYKQPLFSTFFSFFFSSSIGIVVPIAITSSCLPDRQKFSLSFLFLRLSTTSVAVSSYRIHTHTHTQRLPLVHAQKQPPPLLAELSKKKPSLFLLSCNFFLLSFSLSLPQPVFGWKPERGNSSLASRLPRRDSSRGIALSPFPSTCRVPPLLCHAAAAVAASLSRVETGGSSSSRAYWSTLDPVSCLYLSRCAHGEREREREREFYSWPRLCRRDLQIVEARRERERWDGRCRVRAARIVAEQFCKLVSLRHVKCMV